MLRTSEVRARPRGLLCALVSAVVSKVPGRNRDPGPLPMIGNGNSCVAERAGVWPGTWRTDSGDAERHQACGKVRRGQVSAPGADGEAGGL